MICIKYDKRGNEMRSIIVVGLGSMGKRRVRLIKETFSEYIVYGIDLEKSRREEVEKIYKIECFADIKNVESKTDIVAAFICTSPLSHNLLIKKCLEQKWNVFTELNLVSDGYEENIKLAEKNKCILFLSSTFLYRDEINYIKNHIDSKQKWNYIYHVGQYLPDWHPWENYREYFVGDIRTNGCRELMAIELPWITKIFGSIEDFRVSSDKLTNLDIQYNDNYMIQLYHKGGNKGILLIDVVSPVAVRNLEIYTENRYLKWSGTPDTLYKYNQENDCLEQIKFNEKVEHVDGYRNFVIENAYRNEIIEFMKSINNGKEQIYTFEDDLKILSIIDKLEDRFD